MDETVLHADTVQIAQANSGKVLDESSRGVRERWEISANYWVERCRIEELSEFDRQEWAELGEASYASNVFHQPWFFLPAYKQFATDQQVECVLIYERGKTPAEPSTLCAMYPIVRQKTYQGVWTEAIKIWTHPFCYLNTPLIRKRHGVACVSGLFDWVRANCPEVGVIEFEDVTADDEFHHALNKIVNDRFMLSYVLRSYSRAKMDIAGDVDEYLSDVLSKHHGREMRRQRRRLTEAGVSELRKPEPDEPAELWIAEFLELESKGWKGAEGTAIETNQSQRDFFCEMIRSGHSLGKVELSGLFDGERAVALKCNLNCGRGSYAFKIAYDEEYKKFSPGVQLELDTIRDLFATQQVDWMDSCACVNHPMIDRLWKERRGIQTIAIAMPKTRGQLVLGMMQAKRWLRRWWKRTDAWSAMEANF